MDIVSTNADIVIASGRMGGTNAIFIRDPASFHVDYYGASFLKHLKIASGLHTEVFDSFDISTDMIANIFVTIYEKIQQTRSDFVGNLGCTGKKFC